MEEKGRESYPSDLTDEQREEISALCAGMRNCTWSKGELTDAMLYWVDSGCKWSQLPHDFPPYSTVHSFYHRARISGLWDKILEHLVKKTQTNAGCKESPSYAIIDSQSVKTVAASEAQRIDGGKKQQTSQHIVVDVLGCLLSVVVHAANIHGTKVAYLPQNERMSDFRLTLTLIFQRKSSPINGKSFLGDGWLNAPSPGSITPDASVKIMRFPSHLLRLWSLFPTLTICSNAYEYRF